jgi:Haem-degrading
MTKQTRLFRAAVAVAVVVAAFMFGSAAAWAQGATPAPFNKVTVSADVAKRTLMKAAINADTARAIVDACVEWTKAEPGNISIAIYVLSPTGQIVDSHQMDGVVPIGSETALLKAKTALYARTSRSDSITSMAGSFGSISARRRAWRITSWRADCRSSWTTSSLARSAWAAGMRTNSAPIRRW